MEPQSLFPLMESQAVASVVATAPSAARVVRPRRQQVVWEPHDLDAALRPDHPARAIWALLERLDLHAFYADIKAVLDRPGRPTTDPRVLLSVWLLGTVEGVGSARQLARLCAEHDAYRWLCGGVPINYHMLADFRVAHPAALDDLLTQTVAALLAAGAVSLARVAQDGMRVRASAGASSFRRKARLEEYLAEARAQVVALAAQREHPDPGVSRRQQAARERAARERQQRVEQALALLPQVEAAKAMQQERQTLARRAKVTEARASTTDPEARVMKMADGGFRPAYNVQFATDQSRGVIVGAAVTNAGSDAHEAPPMVDQVAARTGQVPRDYLVDGGFASREAITQVAQAGSTVYAPVRQPKWWPEERRYEARYRDSAAVIAWRERMATEGGKTVLRQRGAIAEWANAQVSQHGLRRFTVRGLAKVTSVVLLTAVVHNLLRWIGVGV
jgi:transposase